MSDKYILIFGNPVDGFTYRGPFDTEEKAIEYGDPIAEEWWTAPLTPPDHIIVTVEAVCTYCGHLWTNHIQYICRECPCRGMVPPDLNNPER